MKASAVIVAVISFSPIVRLSELITGFFSSIPILDTVFFVINSLSLFDSLAYIIASLSISNSTLLVSTDIKLEQGSPFISPIQYSFLFLLLIKLITIFLVGVNSFSFSTSIIGVYIPPSKSTSHFLISTISGFKSP